MAFGVDYAWHGDLGPFIKALKAAKVTFAARYLSHTPGKNLTPAEASALSAAGIWIVTIWETTADRALSGHAGGVQDAKDAAAQAAACGMPAGRPVYFAVDFDATGGDQAAINAYLDGAGTVLGKSAVGVYGEYSVVAKAMQGGHAAWGYQTYAWSSSNWYAGAQLQQYSNDHTIGGVGLDYDRSTRSDFGQWRIGWTPTPPKPTPTPTPHPVPTPTTEDDMPTGQLKDGANAVTPITFKRGAYKEIGFGAGDDPKVPNRASLLVQVHDFEGWHDNALTVAAKDGQPIVKFPDPATTNIVRVVRTDGGDVPVAWEVS